MVGKWSKMQCLSKRMETYQISFWKQKLFHTNPRLYSQPTFSEKPAWLRKFKLKQAAFQKDDGLPTFLKKGLVDKILYNLSLFGVIGGVFWAFKDIHRLAVKKE